MWQFCMRLCLMYDILTVEYIRETTRERHVSDMFVSLANTRLPNADSILGKRQACWFTFGPTLYQRPRSGGGTSIRVSPSGQTANTKHLYNICTMLVQRRRRWADVVQMLYKCFVFAGQADLLGCRSRSKTLWYHYHFQDNHRQIKIFPTCVYLYCMFSFEMDIIYRKLREISFLY